MHHVIVVVVFDGHAHNLYHYLSIYHHH